MAAPEASFFQGSSLQDRYAFLDNCPEHLVESIITFPVGTLNERVQGVIAWRTALHNGHLPDDDVWPPPSIAGPVRRAFETMELARFFKDQEELVDELLLDLLSAWEGQAKWLREQVEEELRERKKLERWYLEKAERERVARKKNASGGAPKSGDGGFEGFGKIGSDNVSKGGVGSIALDQATVDRLIKQARVSVEGAELPDADDFIEKWEARARAWNDIAEVFGDLGQLMRRGWDLTQGVLKHTGWADLLRLRELVAELPQLREIIQTLGRLQQSEADESTMETIFEPMTRLEEEQREIPTPLVPAETRGLERSGEIARMLPVEAVAFGHPKMRMLWHARRAERALLCYRVEGVEIERTFVTVDDLTAVKRKIPRPERGPVIAVVDTSGSMSGVPERVAKALVLEAARTAHTEKRRCYLYAYSGPGQVLEHELDLSPEGMGRLLRFLSQSFGGGTDIGALQHAVDRLEEEEWRKADVLLVTDGEWRAHSQLIASVAHSKENGSRYHGVQIGNRGRSGLHELCDPVHVFEDWNAVTRHR